MSQVTKVPQAIIQELVKHRNAGLSYRQLGVMYRMSAEGARKLCKPFNVRKFVRVRQVPKPKRHATYSQVRWHAKRRGLQFSLTREEFLAIVSSPCAYGQSAPDIVIGIDRKDNLRGYDLNNCIPCCFRHNHLRSNVFTHEEFKDAVSRYAGLQLCGNLHRG